MAVMDLAHAIISPPPAPVEPPRSVVLAIDGNADSDDAVAVALRLAEKSSARINVVSVAELSPTAGPWPVGFGDIMLMPPIPADSRAAESAQLARVRAQLARVQASGFDWTVSMRSGIMGVEVAKFASAANADLIVLGRGRHGMLDRLLGEEHLTRLLRVAGAPVLAIEPSFQFPARRAAIAIDFSERNLSAARRAIPYLAADAAVYLVHVKPDPPFGVPHPGQWIRSYEDGVRTGLRRFIDELGFPPEIQAEPIVLNGHPGVAIADFARASRCDLIVAGSHGSGFWNRLVIGSVTSHLLRHAVCSLLLVPDRD